MSALENRNWVLLVEDNAHDADLTCITFKRCHVPYPIIHVQNGEDVMDCLLKTGKYNDSEPKDLPLAVVLDLKLPRVGGLEILNNIRSEEKTKTLPVIILTSSKEDLDTEACQKLGVTSYQQKPVSFDDFKNVVNDIGGILSKLSQPGSPPPMVSPS